MCGAEGSINFDSVNEQLELCVKVGELHFGFAPASFFAANPDSWSYPVMDQTKGSAGQTGKCKTNYNGEKSGYTGANGDIVFCKCSEPTKYTIEGMPNVVEKVITLYKYAGTWEQERQFCADKGGRLPFVSELCAAPDAKPQGGYCDGVGAGETGSTDDKWAAVLDYEQQFSSNGVSMEYFGCSSDLMDNNGNDRRGCEAHGVHAGGKAPGWKDQGASARWKGWTYCVEPKK